MNGGTVLNFVLVVVFILIGGVFAATEIALVSLREGQLRTLHQHGRRGERAVALARNPNRFLSSVQIGVTVAGFFSAAYGASTLAPSFAPTLQEWGLSVATADVVALVGTTLVISYLSLVLGELVPKRIALQNATGVALVTAPPLDRFAGLVRPVIWLLSVSTNALVRVLGGDPARRGEEITHEELRDLVTGHSAVAEEERRVLTEVFDAARRSLVEVMRPRTEVDFLGADTPVRRARGDALALGHSRYPVRAETSDDVVGFVHLRDLLLARGDDEQRTVGALVRPLLRLPGSKPALAALTVMRQDNAQIALVVDEYGGTAGIVTLEDIVEEVVGEIGDEFDPQPSQAAEEPGPTHVDGRLLVEDFESDTGTVLPKGPYETLAGFVMYHLARLPRVGDRVEVDGWRLTVEELEGRRIAALRVTPVR